MLMKRLLILSAILAALAGFGCAGGGGGGGGGGPTTFLLFGRVLWIETGGPTNPEATVRVGTETTTTDAFDGSWQLSAPAGATEVTVTFAPSGGGTPIVRTFTFDALNASKDIGDLYIGPESVDVIGKVISSADGSNVPGAAVAMAGIHDTTAADGTFRLEGVAYSSSSLAVFLGLQGSITKTGFFTQFFSPPTGATAGVVDVGVIQMTPEGSTTPPPAPFNISGSVLPVADGPGATVELLSGASVIRTTTADASGRYTFWAPAGTYTVRATNGGKTGTAPVTVTSVNQPVTTNVTIS